MTRWVTAFAAASLLAGCQAHARRPPPAGRSPEQSELFVYLRAHGADAARLRLSFETVALLRDDGTAVPLEVAGGPVSGPGQRLLAWGRVPHAAYAGLTVKIARAVLGAGDAGADLLVEAEPVRVEEGIELSARGAAVVQLDLELPRSTENGYGFQPSLRLRRSERVVAQPLGYCSSSAMDVLTVFDRRRGEVVGAIATGRAPRGIALDPLRGRVFVAASGADRIDVIDAAGGEPLPPIRLEPADRPEDVRLTPDGRVLVTANAGSSSASFLDPERGLELGRVTTGEEPNRVLIDRKGRRAYVLSRRDSAITVVDVPNRAVVGTLATDAQPVRAALNAAGTRLYVVHAGSPYLNVYALPDLSAAGRAFVGLGASGLQVDPTTDLLYVATSDEPRIQVLDPLSLVPVHHVEVGGAATDLALDELDNTLFALVPATRSVAVIDLASRRTLARFDVGEAPHDLALSRERH